MSAPAAPGFGTLAIHAGSNPDPITGAVVTPISLATTFVQKSPGEHTVSETAHHTSCDAYDRMRGWCRVFVQFDSE